MRVAWASLPPRPPQPSPRTVSSAFAARASRVSPTSRRGEREPRARSSYVSKYEAGDRGLEVGEFLEICETVRADPLELLRRVLRG
jgi:hypothetical protein